MKEIQLNIAATCSMTQALGPGKRAVVWVQGCVFRCPGCIAPDWIPMKPAHLVSPMALARQLLDNPNITGLTLSGGEPMIQAEGLTRLIDAARKIRPIDVICFTGFQLEQLRKTPPSPGVFDLLASVDVLIDGPYINRLNDDRGVRGSSNQRIHYLTDRLSGVNLETNPRKAEIMVHDGHAILVGVPSHSLLDGFTLAMRRVQEMAGEGRFIYERA